MKIYEFYSTASNSRYHHLLLCLFFGSQPPSKKWWFLLDDDTSLQKKWWFVIQTIKIILVALFKWIRSTYFKSQFQTLKNDGQGLPGLPHENSHDNGKSPFSIGDASSNGCFSSVMLVFQVLFWGITRTHPKPRSFRRTGGNASMR